MTKNPFEAFWKKWQNGIRQCRLDQEDFQNFKEEFFSLCEKQAKKADNWGLFVKNYGSMPDAGSQMHALGQRDAFRLVQGKGEQK